MKNKQITHHTKQEFPDSSKDVKSNKVVNYLDLKQQLIDSLQVDAYFQIKNDLLKHKVILKHL